jgi:hypothetical protein
MTLGPIVILTGQNPELLAGAFSSITGSPYFIWEIDVGLSPILIVFLLLGLAQAIRNMRTNAKPTLSRSQFISLVLLALVVWTTTEMTIAKGAIYTLTKQLPVFKSLHVNVRFAASFIFPLTLIGAFRMHRYFSVNFKPVHFGLGVLITGISLLTFFSFSEFVHNRDFNVNSSNILHNEIQSGMRLDVTHITDGSGWEGFSAHSSSYRPYEPVFGYKLESFAPEIHPGKVFEVSDGYFNMTNPASLVFPEINNLHLFERIKVTERDKLEIFLARGQPEWKIPFAQRFLNVLSLIALIFTVGVLLVAGAIRIKMIVRNGT